MKNLLVLLLLSMTACKVQRSEPYVYKIEYIGTKVKAYTDSYNFNDIRKDIVVYKFVNGRYIKTLN